MAKTRMVNTRFWNDGFVSQLDPIEKLLFIYFITNEHTNISGIYELPLKIAAIETGIDSSMFQKIMPRLQEKIIYIENWVCVINFPKHQDLNNQKIKRGIEIELEAVPSHILQEMIAYGYPMDRLSHSNSNSNSNSNENTPAFAGVPSKKTLKEFRNLRRIEAGKEPLPNKKLTPKQVSFTKRAKAIDYFHKKGTELGYEYLLSEDTQANRIFLGKAREFEKRYGDNYKEVIDWWFESDNAWCDYHPSNFFSINTYLKFDNRNKSNKPNIIEL